MAEPGYCAGLEEAFWKKPSPKRNKKIIELTGPSGIVGSNPTPGVKNKHLNIWFTYMIKDGRAEN